MGSVRYLVELTSGADFEPTLATHAVLSGEQLNQKISVLAIGEPESSYWRDWGGTYDNLTTPNIEIFFEQFLQRADSREELLVLPNSFYVENDWCVYLNTDLYVWQYFRQVSEIKTTFGFSTAVPNPLEPSNDEIDGVSYPVRFKVPRFSSRGLPDPINGLVLQPAFTIQLKNGDRFFDNAEVNSFFNTPVVVYKSTVENPTKADFEIVQYGLVDQQSVDSVYFTLKCVDVFRTLTEEVCADITSEQFPNAGDNIDKKMPVAYGVIRGAKLIKVGAGQFIASDPDYLVSVEAVFDNDGKSVSFTVTDGVIFAGDEAKTCDFTGLGENRVGEIIVKEVSEKSRFPYVQSVWDIEEVQRYIAVSPRVSVYFERGTVKKFVEEMLKNDSAFFFTKNDGLLTIRMWGLDYSVHQYESWLHMRHPKKTFTDSNYFASSVAIEYGYNFADKEAEKVALYSSEELRVVDEYNKFQRKTYETTIDNRDDAETLAYRLFNRLSIRAEMFRAVLASNTAKVNYLDTVILPMVYTDRVYSRKTRWIVRNVDPAQDWLDLEERSGVVYSDGILSHVSSEKGSGELSHISNENQSGTLSKPFSVIEG